MTTEQEGRGKPLREMWLWNVVGLAVELTGFHWRRLDIGCSTTGSVAWRSAKEQVHYKGTRGDGRRGNLPHSLGRVPVVQSQGLQGQGTSPPLAPSWVTWDSLNRCVSVSPRAWENPLRWLQQR